jgi:hypothetical protein
MTVCWKCAGHRFGLSLRKSTQDARTPRCRFCRQGTCLDPKEAYMLLGIIGEIAGRHITAPGDGDTTDRARGAVARGMLER